MKFPRCLGALASIWLIRTWIWPGEWPSDGMFVAANLSIAVGAAGLSLWPRRLQASSATAIAIGGIATILVQPDETNSPVTLLVWVSVIVACTTGRPTDRALLLRVCVSCVYGFTALAKSNPSFLAGDQLVRIASTREHMAWTLDLMSGPAGIVFAVGTVSAEFFLAFGLWFRSTRRIAAAVGIALHVALVPIAATSWGSGVLFLSVLNLGLLAMYPAFWHPIHAVDPLATRTPEQDSPGWNSESTPISN